MSSLPAISTCDEGTPERALLRFLHAWDKRDWDEMAWASQTSWRRDRRQKTGSITREIRQWYQTMRIDHAEILDRTDTPSVNPEKPGVALTDVRVQMTISFKHETGRWLMPTGRIWQFRLIKEDEEGWADQNGEWGVHPSSMRPEDENQQGQHPPLSPNPTEESVCDQ